MRLTKTHFENAIEGLRANRLRVLLTTLGVTIGVASITALFALTSGANHFFNQQIASVTDTVALVRPNSHTVSLDTMFTDLHALPPTSTLTEKDARDLGRIANVTVAPMSVLHTSLHARDRTIDQSRATLIASNPSLMTVAELELFDGQFLVEDGGSSGIVMGNQLAIDLFGTEHAIGNVVTIRDEPFTVIGVLRTPAEPMHYLGVDLNQSAIISLSAIRQFTQNVAQIQQIVMMASDTDSLEAATSQAKTILEQNHTGEKDYVVLTGNDLSGPTKQLFSGITAIVGVIAGIALLVGGIGIMNSMLVNVAERRREVGIRKALGATNGSIVNQFMIEATIIGFIGGAIGYGLGLAIAFGSGLFMPFNPIVQWQVAALSIGTAVFIGIVFGLYPAVRAARQDPIELLNQP